MRMNEIRYEGPPPIDGYGPGGFRIGGDWHAGAVVILPEGVAPMSGQGLSEEAIAPVIAAAGTIDVVLIGQGPEIAPLAAPLREALEAAGVGVEIMATPSACRTYNVLLAEDRRVAAMLLPV